jgi:adenosine deaminase
LGVTRIAHGIRIIGHPESERVIELAIERGVVFDLAITSNYLTGVVPMGHMHPIETMMRAGLKVTIGTDDPVQCDVSLDSEFEKLQSWGIKIERILNYYKLPSP